jgi:hypothetical protein
MGDSVFELLTTPFKDMTREVNRKTDMATRYTLRATGRKMMSVAKVAANATVYPGELNKHPDQVDYRALAERGSFRRSLSNAKGMNRVGTGDYSLKVGSFGRVRSGSELVRYGTRRGVHIDSRTLKHLNKAGQKHGKITKGESSGGQVRGVVLYRAKIEALYGPIHKGVQTGDAVIRKTYEEAMAKALANIRK